MNPSVAVDRLSKVYKVYSQPWDRLFEVVSRRRLHRPFVALEGISFSVREGEALGIVGQNGAGKSTLLKILAGITAPTSGTVEVSGKVASILELGSGFHPEFTGRQNIVLNAALLGLNEAEIEDRLPGIVEFSELGDFIDQPVKCYSTGMAMRLGFAIAVQVDPDVLIIDEALSVGDGYFQKKCMDRLRQYLDGGRTLLFCSHAMYYVSAFCHQALWMRHGKIEALGAVSDVVRAYETFLDAKAVTTSRDSTPTAPKPASESLKPARLREVRFRGGEGEEGGPCEFRSGERWEIEVTWETDNPRIATHLGVAINRSDGLEVCAFGTHRDDLAPFEGERSYRIRLEMPALPLVKGEFMLYVYLLDEVGLHVYDQRWLPTAFVVKSHDYHFGVFSADHRWADATGSVLMPAEIVGLAAAGKVQG
ncbi:MAG: ABC transporter ATP-binding protein [Thermoanaerobaculia bacterium]|nr:ABC transporter ATP-binding protein [Thermoanaerobaculia bacterium]